MLGIGEFIAFLQGRGLPSGWIIDIWNCHGVVKPEQFAGYGNQSDEILKDLEEHTGEKYVWLSVGYYTIPIQERKLKKIREAGLEKEFTERTARVCDWIVYDRNGGAINMSGFYTITDEELLALEKVIARVLIKALKQERTDEITLINKGEVEKLSIGDLLKAIDIIS